MTYLFFFYILTSVVFFMKYCSKRCQDVHWPEHKKICTDLGVASCADILGKLLCAAMKEKEETDTLESIPDIIIRLQAEALKDPSYRRKYGHIFDIEKFEEIGNSENYAGNMICYPEQPPSIHEDNQTKLSGAPLRGMVEHNPDLNAKLKECEEKHILHLTDPGKGHFGEFQNDMSIFAAAGANPSKLILQNFNDLFDLRDRLGEGENSFLFVPLEVSFIQSFVSVGRRWSHSLNDSFPSNSISTFHMHSSRKP